MDVARAVHGADHRHVHGEHVLDEHAAVPGLLVELHEALLTVHGEVQGLLDRSGPPVGVVVLAAPGVDQNPDLSIAGDVGERI